MHFSDAPRTLQVPPLNNQPPRVILTWLRNSLFLGGCFPRLVEACPCHEEADLAVPTNSAQCHHEADLAVLLG